MDSVLSTEYKKGLGGTGIGSLVSFRFIAMVIVLCFLGIPSARGTATYSGTSIGSNLIAYGWGVTDVTTYSYLHTAEVSTTLTSPLGRTAPSGTRSARNSIRADVYLAFVDDDVGFYETRSTHDAYCRYMGHFINGRVTAMGKYFGYDISWYTYHSYDEILEYCRYQIISPCNVTCKQGGDGIIGDHPEPCQDELKIRWYWSRWSQTSPKNCLGWVPFPATPPVQCIEGN